MVSRPLVRDREAERDSAIREERRLRMLQRELEREEDRSRKKRKETKHTYAAKVTFLLRT